VIRLGRPAAAIVYAVAGLLAPISIVAAVVMDALPLLSLVALLPSLLLVKPLQWAFTAPADAVPIPALGANVAWIHLTNLVLAGTLVAALFM
jgi:1,4-dihydroxy-2-naphthoate octaprenyltransferase